MHRPPMFSVNSFDKEGSRTHILHGAIRVRLCWAVGVLIRIGWASAFGAQMRPPPGLRTNRGRAIPSGQIEWTPPGP